jgi:hypothetical protein
MLEWYSDNRGKIIGEINMRILLYSICIFKYRIVSRISEIKIYKRMLKPDVILKA